MLNCIVSSLERGASKEPLFEFTPEFYMEAAINAFHGLRHYFHPTTNFDDIPGTRSSLLLECFAFLFFWRVVLLVRILSFKRGKSYLISTRLCVELTPKVQIQNRFHRESPKAFKDAARLYVSGNELNLKSLHSMFKSSSRGLIWVLKDECLHAF